LREIGGLCSHNPKVEGSNPSPATSIHNGLLVSGFLSPLIVDALSMHKTPLAFDLGFVF